MLLQPIFGCLVEGDVSARNIDDWIRLSQRTNDPGHRLYQRIIGDKDRIEKSVPVFRFTFQEVLAMIAISQRAIEVYEHAFS